MLDFEVSVRNRLWKVSQSVKGVVKDFLTTEDGDTNFISIIIVLMIVLGLALAFRNQINTLVTGWWSNIQADGAEIDKIDIG
ncbi:MAG: Flp1 family type IVb pilin [Lachnospiraceae bacterium]|nr:Flp1 family type IVb pilin [Lachnospiraceae bacterium]